MQDLSKLEHEVKIISNKICMTKLPEMIIKELDLWKMDCDKIKNHPLGYLKNHENSGTEGNSYQVSVPSLLVEQSYWLPFTLRTCAKLFGGNSRDYHLQKWDGHFDGLDVWINYAYKDNYNPAHSHTGFVSGVIYYNNKNDPTLFTDEKIEIKGDKGEMILFDSGLEHCVKKQKLDYERITFAFNIRRKDYHARS